MQRAGASLTLHRSLTGAHPTQLDARRIKYEDSAKVTEERLAKHDKYLSYLLYGLGAVLVISMLIVIATNSGQVNV